MCKRYSFKNADIKKLAEQLNCSVEDTIKTIKDRHNFAPMQNGPVFRASVQGGIELSILRWGLIPSWAKDTQMASQCLNARAETADIKPAFRESWEQRRCLIPASGYFEWQTVGKTKQPWRFILEDESPMMMAGMWSSWSPQGQGQSSLETYTILTTSPNALMAQWHDRMPVILPPEKWFPWLQSDSVTAKQCIEPYPHPMRAYRVPQEMNNWRFDRPEATEPVRELF